MLDKIFTLRMDQETFQLLEAIAKKTNWSKGQIIRLLITKFYGLMESEIQLNQKIADMGGQK
jgi:predicted DNA-binding protein